jgi:hypothetical protein
MLSDIVSLSNIAVAVFALAALYFTRVQLRQLGSQIEQANQATISQAYSEISQTSTEINNIFLDHPEWYPYFYKGEEVSQEPGDQKLRNQLEHISEVFLDFLDMLLELRNVTPFSTIDWSLWGDYFRFIFNSSPALRSYVLSSTNSIPDYQLATLGFIVVRDDVSGQVVGSWHAREFDEDDESHANAMQRLWGNEWREHVAPEGYPWVRTWIMRRIDDADPSVVAPVSMSSPQEARVSVHWLSECSDLRVEETLNSWILGILTGSKLITRAIVTTHQMSEPQGENTYQIRDIKESKRLLARSAGNLVVQEPFLVPRFKPVYRRLLYVRTPSLSAGTRAFAASVPAYRRSPANPSYEAANPRDVTLRSATRQKGHRTPDT